MRRANLLLSSTSSGERQVVEKKCRAIVLRYAALSAGMSVVPLPGLDALTDIGLLVRAMNAINDEFGLSPAQLDQLHPDKKLIAYQAILGVGSLFIGKVVTVRLVSALLKRIGVRALTRQSAKFVPIAGQLLAATIGFSAFRALCNEHIAACLRVVASVQAENSAHSQSIGPVDLS